MTDYKPGGPVQRPRPNLPDPFKGIQPLAAERVSGPSGWYTIPKPIRFVIWVQAIVFLLGFAAAAVGAVFWALAFGLALTQL